MEGNKLSCKDLMVEDLVNYRGLVNRVAPADFCQKAWIEEIEPIPLTPEILEKNGFDASKDFNMRYWSKSYDEIIKVGELEEGHLYLEAKGKKGRYEGDCNFLHELQHALRLCGIEKEIEL